MKDKILTLIIGILIGAIIASACFLIFGKSNSNPGGDRMNGREFDANMVGGERMEKPEGMSENGMGEPPAMPTEGGDNASADA